MFNRFWYKIPELKTPVEKVQFWELLESLSLFSAYGIVTGTWYMDS